MTQEVRFMDTSVLLNLLDVPGKNSHHAEVVVLFKRYVASGEVLLIVPVTAIIETGNHIAQLPDRGVARQKAEGLCRFLRSAHDGKPPWTVSKSAWDEPAVLDLIDGAELVPSLPDLALQGVGAGDAAILHERRRYLADVDVPSGLSVTVWTYDTGLAAHA